MLIGTVALLSLAIGLGLCGMTDAFASLQWLYVLPLGFLGSFVLLAALVFGILCFLCAIVRTDVPQEKDSKLYRFVINLMTEAALPILQVRMHVSGLEKTPKSGRFLLVCNHLNELDPVVLLHYFRKSQLAFISKRENKTMFMVGKLMHKIQCQLVNRENDREALKTILKCISIIKEDKASIAVFPEGYISEDLRLRHFRSGVFKIATKTQVPIVVCTLRNTEFAFGNARKLKPTHVHLHLLDVITPEQYAGKTTVQLGEEIYEMMLADLGPQYAPLEENA